MIYLPPPQSPQAQVRQGYQSELEQALGMQQKINQIKQKMNASYPAPKARGNKVYSSKPDSVDL